ncbi:MAG: TerD family protein [Micrococcales bacterium]|nr:TerD family protein [Micrococcales bacterium]
MSFGSPTPPPPGGGGGISLSKGGNLSLSKTDPGLVRATVGLGWDVNSFTGEDYDLDAIALLVAEHGKVRSDADFVFFNQMQGAGGAVTLTGDNRTGEGDGDDEQILVDLSRIPADVQKVVFGVAVYSPETVTFGQVRNAFIRVVNTDTNAEIVRFDLGEDYSTERAVVAGEIYRNGAEWKFRAIGQGYADGLAGVARDFGVNI